MFTRTRAGLASLAVAGVMFVPVAAATSGYAAPSVAMAHCAHHTVGTCRANSPHPNGATAECKDGTYSYSAHFSGTCSHHHGVKYWYR
ncbi:MULTISPECIES: DUF3761 domain-containing protein [unclassified Streptomyces]|uniref:DUF3761 domain-containing protein n=1 Tax=unclassified Streptomyces TaxID=2593676 RepID=UPI00339E129F